MLTSLAWTAFAGYLELQDRHIINTLAINIKAGVMMNRY